MNLAQKALIASKREELLTVATAAMQGILANPEHVELNTEEVGEIATNYAELLLNSVETRIEWLRRNCETVARGEAA